MRSRVLKLLLSLYPACVCASFILCIIVKRAQQSVLFHRCFVLNLSFLCPQANLPGRMQGSSFSQPCFVVYDEKAFVSFRQVCCRV